jgi:hypothetical protein
MSSLFIKILDKCTVFIAMFKPIAMFTFINGSVHCSSTLALTTTLLLKEGAA